MAEGGSPTQNTGRIRLTERKSRFLYWLMAEERLRLLDERRFAKAAGVNLASYQQQTALIREIRTQIEELALECGWDLGSPAYDASVRVPANG